MTSELEQLATMAQAAVNTLAYVSALAPDPHKRRIMLREFARMTAEVSDILAAIFDAEDAAEDETRVICPPTSTVQ